MRHFLLYAWSGHISRQQVFTSTPTIRLSSSTKFQVIASAGTRRRFTLAPPSTNCFTCRLHAPGFATLLLTLLQMQFILSLIDDGGNRIEKVTVENKVDMQEIIGRQNFFMQNASSIDVPMSIPFDANQSPSIIDGSKDDWVLNIKDFLFMEPFKTGRVFTKSGSISGTGWIVNLPYVITCARVVNGAGSEDLLFQSPDDSIIIMLKVIYTRSKDEISRDYRRDVAFLEMVNVLGSNRAIEDLPLAALSAGHFYWPCRCIIAGMLPPQHASAPFDNQKRIDSGRVESRSSTLIIVSACAEKGFSGAPVLNTDCKIIGMIQGSHGEVIKSAQMIPIDDISRDSSIISRFVPGFSPITYPMERGASDGFGHCSLSSLL